MGDLRALLELRQAWPVGFSRDGSWLLVASDLPGTRQLFRLPAAGGELERLTDLDEPVDGLLLPDDRVLLQVDAAGNERTQLHILGLDAGGVPVSRPGVVGSADGASSLAPLVADPRFIHRSPHYEPALCAGGAGRCDDPLPGRRAAGAKRRAGP